MTPTLNQISEVLPGLPNYTNEGVYDLNKEGAVPEMSFDWNPMMALMQQQSMQYQSSQIFDSEMCKIF
eukprot:CAMPEP_0205819102 /NCGR_PEP_ID=MMETSP0206-20130828/1313_1 /ASSEMBLY_ACC=CAM_ASM_000279 /TAXON_ID=36767 /ORGANISM="Euplotes focardii, Strain TN1" /LENGTH=67 /DNA_ID=CAMNT_0053112239 /DNA_START=26 /DNA_END=229 /DNA_ORIENTATION=+